MKNQTVLFLLFLGLVLSSLGSCGKSGNTGKPPESPDTESRMPIIKEITANSTLENQSDMYNPAHLIDGSSRSWVEGEEGPGIESGFQIRLEDSIALSSIYVKNGYGDPAWYTANNRVKEMIVANDAETEVKILLEDSPEVQLVSLPEMIEGSYFKFKILSVYSGDSYDDTCLAEISFAPIDLANENKPKELPEPIAFYLDGYDLVFRSGGIVEGSVLGMVQCDAPFVSGSWGYTSDGRIYIHYAARTDMNCGPGDSPATPMWKLIGATYIIDDFSRLDSIQF